MNSKTAVLELQNRQAAVGVVNVEHLLDWSRSELAALHGVGPKAIRIIEDSLAGHGWRLREHPRTPHD